MMNIYQAVELIQAKVSYRFPCFPSSFETISFFSKRFRQLRMSIFNDKTSKKYFTHTGV